MEGGGGIKLPGGSEVGILQSLKSGITGYILWNAYTIMK